VYNRPFDDQRQPRIVIETMEFIFLLSKIVSGEMAMISSFALEFENGNNPFADRKDVIHELLSTATTFIEYNGELSARAKELEKIGINAMDAFHIACAEKAGADFFITCDDILVKKCMAVEHELKIKARPLMKFVAEEVFKI
jgi:predicted nucleic acid-binding protein